MESMKVAEMGHAYYRNLWEHPQPAAILSCPAMWDQRADEWVDMLRRDAAYRTRMTERVEATTAFLRQNGQLDSGSRALDIGCGPGLFSRAFAKTAGHVTGVDISPRMIHHARAGARRQGVENVSFGALNFKEESVRSLGWHKQFDLVMSSITPAITGVDDLHKIMEISRGHCLHVSFVEAADSLEQRVAAVLYADEPTDNGHWDGRVFYSVFNLLFLEGYEPQTWYFRQCSEDAPRAQWQLAQRYARELKKDLSEPEEAAETERIHACLTEWERREGGLRRRREECYGYLLWDVNRRRPSRVL